MDLLERALTRQEVVRKTGLSLRNVDKLISSGELPAAKIGRRVVIQPRHVRELLENAESKGIAVSRKDQPPAREQRRAARETVAGFIDALSTGDHARADELIAVTPDNALALEACGIAIRALRLSGRGAELWAQIKEQLNATN